MKAGASESGRRKEERDASPSSSSSTRQPHLRACMSLRNSRQSAARLADFEVVGGGWRGGGVAAESCEEVTE